MRVAMWLPRRLAKRVGESQSCIPQFSPMKVPSSLAIAAAFSASSVAALDARFFGINYDLRTNQWGGCKNFHTIAEDFNILKRLTDYVRIYGMEFDCTQNILKAARNSGLKVWLGLWSEVGTTVVRDGREHEVIDSFPSQFDALKKLMDHQTPKWINNDEILGIQVSSEALYRYYVQGPGKSTGSSDRYGIDTVIGHLNTVRRYLRDHNLTFPVVISDVMDMYTMFPELYDEVDVVAVNQFSFWENKTADVVAVNQFSFWENKTAEEGAHFTFKRFQEQDTRAKRAGKLAQLHEAGWSTAGEDPVVNEASPQAQGVFTQDFLTLVPRQNLNTFYFAAFDLPFNPTEIERNFGIHDVNRTLKPGVEAVQVGAPLQAVRLWAGDNVIKAHRYWNANDSVNENFGGVYAAKPSVVPSGLLDDEIWLWDKDSSILYSKSSNQCLESTGEDNDTQNLHTSPCSKDNRDQKWSVADGNIASQNDAKFCIDVNRPTTPDVNLVVTVSPCNKQPTQSIAIVPATDEPLEIGIKTNGDGLTPFPGGVKLQSTSHPHRQSHQWFYDPVIQSITSKSLRLCLDAAKGVNDGPVGLGNCDPNNVNQKWVLNDFTGQIHHATHYGFSLGTPDDVDGLVRLLWSDKNNVNQHWNIKPVKAKA
ncbi:hypothetical protein DYB30_012795 [Aphanomyces astaci]|uniref:glucan endo-1,3-beta-D-glucosidase n=2 Tax=Aphanomyces astaci TaxID=112090 RepID=A0A397CFX7_APHAT|nr:hypothetical protein DYB30_012795 [Aphanomyces astaci]